MLRMECKKSDRSVQFRHGVVWHRCLIACLVVFFQTARICVGQWNTTVNSIVYKTPVRCAGQVLRADLRQISGFRRSLLSCAASCSADSSCKVFVYDPATQVCTLGSSVSAENCTNMEAANGMVHFQKSNAPSGETACKNGGTLTGNICQCAPAYYGDHCDLGPMQDCSDYYTILNMSSSGIYVIHPVTSTISFSVYCNVQSESNAPSGETACKNGGTLTGNICQCAPAYFGDHCDLGPMQDCSDYYTILNITSDGIYVIHPVTSTYSFSVFCSLMLDVRTNIMIHGKKSSNFTRPWEEYRDGFGNLTSDHWLGLKYLYLLTANRHYDLRFLVRVYNSSVYIQYYSYFKMSDETNGFHIQHFNFTKRYTLGDFLTPVVGVNFSTFDNDNDGDNTVNCAARFSGGWWYKGSNCTKSNPTGPLTLPASGIRLGVDNEAFWQESLGNLAPFKISVYLVRI